MNIILHIRKKSAEKISSARNSRPLLSVELSSTEAVEDALSILNLPNEKPPRITRGELIAFGLINKAIITILDIYESEINSVGFIRAFTNIQTKINYRQRNAFIFEFIDEFSSGNSDLLKELVPTNKTTGKEFIKDIVLYYIENKNEAAIGLREFFDKKYLNSYSTLENIFKYNKSFFRNEPGIGTSHLPLIDFLEQPLQKHPHSLLKQLLFIKNRWNKYLGDDFIREILLATDTLKEEKIPPSVPAAGNPPSIVPEYKTGKKLSGLKLFRSEFDLASASQKLYDEPVKFSPDDDWMPNVVMIAKNIFVWLYQLTKKYNREIKHLNDVPEEEFEWLSSLGINAVWLIGIWKRSSASEKIKHLMGNKEAIASAYSIYDYVVSPALGGDEALEALKNKAKKFGIKLASDMVPNHTGIYSDWIKNHPDYFIQRSEPPFNDYSFTGPNLSEDKSVEIRIEDGYWERSNAAVVFQRKEVKTGKVSYIYHGNDGTNMPWNDTAQLDMLKKEVREAVIGKIIEVANRFPIIRFDAAMTLTKLHFQRLWYPKPGSGGDIPSRAEYSLNEKEFNRLFPREFWREVVDRIQKEKPNTLLLAEAFWLMEGYFVRTLGMHRVYNSAFMHMMMNEENEKYHKLISNTLEFEPEILKRYVNFMSNPDEETAKKQFGTGDKYFGVLTLMVTLPGLPLFAHGQLEGFTEKYGMEYSKSYYNETPDVNLIKRFRKEISPLLSMRKLFSGVENFWFYYALDEHNNINYNIFAFSNGFKGKKALVLFNNKYDRASARINLSVAKLVRTNSTAKSKRTTFAREFGIKAGEDYFYIARDVIGNKEILLSGAEINRNGLSLKLDGFKYLVLTDFEEIYDHSGEFHLLYEKLNLTPVKNISEYLNEIQILPIHEAFVKIFDDALISNILFPESVSVTDNSAEDSKSILFNRIKHFAKIAAEKKNILLPNEMLLAPVRKLIDSIDTLELFLSEFGSNGSNPTYSQKLLQTVKISSHSNYRENALLLLLNRILTEISSEGVDITKLKFNEPLRKIFERLGRNNGEIQSTQSKLAIIKIIEDFIKTVKLNKTFSIANNKFDLNKKHSFSVVKKIQKLLVNPKVKKYIDTNKYKRVVFFRKENFEELLDWYLTLLLLKEIELFEFDETKKNTFLKNIKFQFELISQIKQLAETTGFRYWNLLSSINKLKFYN